MADELQIDVGRNPILVEIGDVIVGSSGGAAIAVEKLFKDNDLTLTGLLVINGINLKLTSFYINDGNNEVLYPGSFSVSSNSLIIDLSKFRPLSGQCRLVMGLMVNGTI